MKKSHDKKLLSLWRQVVKARAGGKCELCMREGRDPHHVIGRRTRATRWDIDNGVYLCPGCHTFKNNSAHQNPGVFHEWIVGIRGEDWWERLKEKSRIIKKWDYEEVKEKLEQELSMYEQV